MRVGFIGLGTMGSGISANMGKAGHEMVVHDARRQAAEKICAAGAEWADSPKAVAQATEIVFTSLPGPREFEAVVRGDNGLLAGMQRGQPLFDLSTNSPARIPYSKQVPVHSSDGRPASTRLFRKRYCCPSWCSK